MNGWIKLHRKILNNDLWTAEPFTKGQAWVDLLLTADFDSGTISATISELSKRWKWTWHKTDRYLKDLEKAGMISATKETTKERPIARPILLYIIKWKDFQAKNDPRPIARPIDDNTNGKTSENLPFYNIKNNNKEGQERACARARHTNIFEEMLEEEERKKDGES